MESKIHSFTERETRGNKNEGIGEDSVGEKRGGFDEQLLAVAPELGIQRRDRYSSKPARLLLFTSFIVFKKVICVSRVVRVSDMSSA